MYNDIKELIDHLAPRVESFCSANYVIAIRGIYSLIISEIRKLKNELRQLKDEDFYNEQRRELFFKTQTPPLTGTVPSLFGYRLDLRVGIKKLVHDTGWQGILDAKKIVRSSIKNFQPAPLVISERSHQDAISYTISYDVLPKLRGILQVPFRDFFHQAFPEITSNFNFIDRLGDIGFYPCPEERITNTVGVFQVWDGLYDTIPRLSKLGIVSETVVKEFKDFFNQGTESDSTINQSAERVQKVGLKVVDSLPEVL